jgi:hypothetical protein
VEEGQEAITGWCVSRRNRGRERGAEEGKRRSPVGGGGLVRNRWAVAVWWVTGGRFGAWPVGGLVRDRYSPLSPVRRQWGAEEAITGGRGRRRFGAWRASRVASKQRKGEGSERGDQRRSIFFFFFGIREIKTEELEGMGRMKSLILLQRVKGPMNFSGLRGCQGPGWPRPWIRPSADRPSKKYSNLSCPAKKKE